MMTKSTLEKQETKLAQLNEQIKLQKAKIDQALGHAIIKEAGLNYANLNQAKIKDFAKTISAYLEDPSQFKKQ